MSSSQYRHRGNRHTKSGYQGQNRHARTPRTQRNQDHAESNQDHAQRNQDHDQRNQDHGQRNQDHAQRNQDHTPRNQDHAQRNQDHGQSSHNITDGNTASCLEAGRYNGSKRPFQGLERSTKDLHRQTVSLERLKMLMDSEMDRSLKSIRTVFNQMRTHLNTRENEMLAELDCVKQQGCEIFKMRQEKAAFLKGQIDRSEKFSETEMGDIRADVKRFVADRMTDEELGRTIRFRYDSDHLKEEILNFGEVIPVRCSYSPTPSSPSNCGGDVHDVQPSQSQSTSHLSTEEDDIQAKASGQHRPENGEHQEQEEKTDEPLTSATPSDEPQSNSRAATPSSTDVHTNISQHHGPHYSDQNDGYRGHEGRGGGRGGHGGRGGQWSGEYRGRYNQSQFGEGRHWSYSGNRGRGRRWTGHRYRQGGQTPVFGDGAS